MASVSEVFGLFSWSSYSGGHYWPVTEDGIKLILKWALLRCGATSHVVCLACIVSNSQFFIRNVHYSAALLYPCSQYKWQLKQSNQLSLPRQDDYETRKDTK